MSDAIASLGAASDSTYDRRRRQKSPPEEGVGAADGSFSATAEPGDLRLVIEDGPAGETPVYTTIDSRTGAVVRKLPEEQVLRLGQAETYVAGQLVKTRA